MLWCGGHSVNLMLLLLLPPLTCSSVRRVVRCDVQQEALIQCVTDVASSINPGLGMEDVTQLCSANRDLLHCVTVARDLCPSMDLLADHAFSTAIDTARSQYNTYCTEDEMSNDNPARCDVSPWSDTPECQTANIVDHTTTDNDDASCNYNPVDAMVQCNSIMAGVDPGHLEGMCDHGEEFLRCMSDIVDDCPQHQGLLTFDLEAAIDTTRYMLDQQCQYVTGDMCTNKLETAKRQCSHLLSDGGGDYCGSLSKFMGCVDNTLTECPNKEVMAEMRNQFDHHCPLGGGATCPYDLRQAMQTCFRSKPAQDTRVVATYCRKSMDFLLCAEDLVDRCHADTRLPDMGVTSAIQETRHWMWGLCADSDICLVSSCPRNLREFFFRLQMLFDPHPDVICTEWRQVLTCADQLMSACEGELWLREGQESIHTHLTAAREALARCPPPP